MKMKLAAVLGTAIIITAGSAFTAFAEEAKVFRLSHGMAADGAFGVYMERFSELVGEKTEGRYQVDVYHNGQLGSERDTVEACQLNNLDFAIVNQAVLANFIPQFSALDLPYLFESYDHVDKVFGGEIGQELLDKMSDIGIVGVEAFESGFRNLTNNKREVNSAADVDGLRIRVMENQIHQETWRKLGADPVPMSWGDAYTAMQQNAIDGQENPTVVIEQNHVAEVNKYISITEHAYSTTFLICSPGAWSSLSEEDQALFKEAASEASAEYKEFVRSTEQDSLELLQEEGMTVSYPDKQEFIDATAEVREAHKDEFGDLIDRIAAAK